MWALDYFLPRIRPGSTPVSCLRQVLSPCMSRNFSFPNPATAVCMHCLLLNVQYSMMECKCRTDPGPAFLHPPHTFYHTFSSVTLSPYTRRTQTWPTFFHHPTPHAFYRTFSSATLSLHSRRQTWPAFLLRIGLWLDSVVWPFINSRINVVLPPHHVAVKSFPEHLLPLSIDSHTHNSAAM
jgi:hypothetical protein